MMLLLVKLLESYHMSSLYSAYHGGLMTIKYQTEVKMSLPAGRVAYALLCGCNDGRTMGSTG